MKGSNALIVIGPLIAIAAVASIVNHCLDPTAEWRFWLPGSYLALSLPSFYAENLRGSLFAGFLTLGGFLMSLKAFIIVNMKKEVFDSEAYKKAWDEAKESGTQPYKTKFQPLRDLSNSIFLAVVTCIGSAVTQLTLGLVPSIFACIFALVFSSIAIGFVLKTLWLIKTNLRVLFDYLDDSDAAP